MRLKLNDHVVKDAKFEKVDSKYLKNVKTIKDEERREREVGEVDLLNIPQKELVGIFNCMDDIAEAYTLRNLNDSLKIDNRDFGEEMYNYLDMLEKKLKMETKDLFELLKDYLVKNKNEKKHEAFIRLLNATCKLAYTDYDDYEYDYYDEHPYTSQKDIDHNFVGDYSLILVKPIPFKIINAIKDEVDKLEEKERQKTLNNFDKKHSTAELDELSNIL